MFLVSNDNLSERQLGDLRDTDTEGYPSLLMMNTHCKVTKMDGVVPVPSSTMTYYCGPYDRDLQLRGNVGYTGVFEL